MMMMLMMTRVEVFMVKGGTLGYVNMFKVGDWVMLRNTGKNRENFWWITEPDYLTRQFIVVEVHPETKEVKVSQSLTGKVWMQQVWYATRFRKVK